VTCGFSPVSSTNKTDHHNITEILLKVALNTITLTLIGYNKMKVGKCRCLGLGFLAPET
jgi:hypothetical protein